MNDSLILSTVEEFIYLEKVSAVASLQLLESKKEQINETLKKIYSKSNNAIISEYLKKSIEKRSNPFLTREWAKTFLCITVPHSKIPSLDLQIQPPNSDQDICLMASYAGKKDYHIYSKELITKLIQKIEVNLNKSFKKEICVDTKAIPEKILAKFANLGEIGLNNCLVCNGSSSVFIASAFIDYELPQFRIPQSSPLPCIDCKECIKLCPTNAITETGFYPEKCISYLTIEKKSPLTPEEKKIIGNWIFGCDICTSACPESQISPPLQISKKWILSLDEKSFNQIFSDSPCLYAGLKKIKHNAS